jgi:DNA polymerase-1
MLALLDSDIIAYRCAATAQNDPDWVATSRCNALVEQILEEVKADEYRLYLSGPNNFRKKIYPAYKANRVQPPPIHLAVCKKFLEEKWGAVWTDGYEADDALGIAQTPNSIICSIDKDLKQIPGLHYNFVKKEFDEVSVEQGFRSFYTQMLVGDASDNIKGCPGIGKAKAPRILAGCETEQEMFDAVRASYNDDDSMFINGQLLYILQEENVYWNPEKFIEHDEEVLSESIQPMQTEVIQSTEHGGTP